MVIEHGRRRPATTETVGAAQVGHRQYPAGVRQCQMTPGDLRVINDGSLAVTTHLEIISDGEASWGSTPAL